MTSFIIVRIGAIAFQLTGLEWSLAKFQALSCFSGTGFTTKEAELITSSPQRRKIASILIVLGNAGLVTMIATFANSLRPRSGLPGWNIPFLDTAFPSWLVPWINLIIIVAAVYIMFRLFGKATLVRRFTISLREKLIKKDLVQPVSFEEVALATGGYGVSKLKVLPTDSLAGKVLSQTNLRSHDITILAIVRGLDTIANPKADTQILAEDELICFGKLENIRRIYSKADQA